MLHRCSSRLPVTSLMLIILLYNLLLPNHPIRYFLSHPEGSSLLSSHSVVLAYPTKSTITTITPTRLAFLHTIKQGTSGSATNHRFSPYSTHSSQQYSTSTSRLKWRPYTNFHQKNSKFDVTKAITTMYSASTTSQPSSSVAPPLVSPMVHHGKEGPGIPTAAFVATTLILPVWAVTILPVTALYQAGRLILGPKPKPATPSQLDSGYTVDTTKLIPRPDRKYDLVVLGATGFTGRLAARHLAKQYTSNKNSGIKWAIAGRNKEKLRKVLDDLATELKDPSIITDIDIIIVDTSVPSTLPKLVEQTRCVASTAGPYTLYGNHVVEFCAKFGTHYVDITGEVDWIRLMINQWQSVAQKTGAILVPFCGHDSIPWDISVSKIHELMSTQLQDELQSVCFWDESIGGAPGGTLATVFSVLEGTAQAVPKFPIDPFLLLPDGKTKSTYVCQSKNPTFIEKVTTPIPGTTYHGRWTMPFVMAGVNHQVVRWSHAQRQQGAPNMTYKEVFLNKNFQSAFTTYAGLLVFGSLLANPITAYLMKKYVLPKPGEGPTMENMENKHFLCVYGEGIGRKGNKVETIFYLPKNAGCLETSRMMMESGLALALSEKQLPVQQGGFYSTSVALGNDILLNRLLATGTEFLSRVVPVNSEPKSKL